MKKYGTYEAIRGIVQLEKLNGEVICKYNDPITAYTVGKNQFEETEDSSLVILEYDTETKELRKMNFSELNKHMSKIRKNGIKASMLIDESDRDKPLEFALVSYKIRDESPTKMSVILSAETLGAFIEFTHRVIKELPLDPEEKLMLIIEMMQMLGDLGEEIEGKVIDSKHIQ